MPIAARVRRDDRDPERADELERDRDPERQPVEGSVEEEVDCCDRAAEQEHVAVRPLPHPQGCPSRHRQQHQGAEGGTEKDRPGRADLVEQRRRQRRPALDRDDRSQHQQSRAARPRLRL
jgi:hypothetical protein